MSEQPTREREVVNVRGTDYFVIEAVKGYPFEDDTPRTLVLERIYFEKTKECD